MNITTKPFLAIFFNVSEKACFAILFFNPAYSRQSFLPLYVQHNVDYVSAADFGGFFIL